MHTEKADMLREEIKPIIAGLLRESIDEKKAKGEKKIKIEDLVQKLMKNHKFKKAAMKFLTDEDAYDGWTNALDGKTYDTLDNLDNGAKRRIVTQRLKDKKIDWAPIAYELWPNMSEDAARSWFSKKVAGKNESFSDEEISKIFQMLNNTL
mgnify:FL=1